MTTDNVSWTVLTGSTGGIGQEIANILAARGNNLILVNRSKPKADIQSAELQAAFPACHVELVTANFMDRQDIAAAIEYICALPGRIEALHNNAGVLTSEYLTSEEGFESHFAVNTLAPYQLTLGLREKMVGAATEQPAMVVNFSSSAIHQQKSLDLDALAKPEEVTGLMGTYAQSKLAVTGVSVALASELRPHNILIRAIDPGATKTDMTTANAGMPKFLQWLAPIFFSPADKQAGKLVEGADPAAFAAKSGILVANVKEKKLPMAIDDASVQRDLIALLDRCLDAGNDTVNG
ncbi:MAG: SDR family NAD(P)-dependent oxidoreductase [Pseudomonadota bacterium]